MKRVLLLLLILHTVIFGKECRVETKVVVRAVYGSGYVESEQQVVVRAGVSGYVKRLLVREGDRVRRGQLLAVIDSGGLEDKIGSLSRKIDFLKERLREGSGFMEALRHRVELARENLEKAKRRLERRRELFEAGVIPREALEESERLYRVALEELRIAEGTLEDRLGELKAELGSLKEEREALIKELERYRIKSPMDGVVLRTFVEEGDYVNSIRENALVSVGTLKKKVVLDVDEEFLPMIKKGQEVYITSDAFPGKVFKGTVSSFDLQSDRSRRVVKVKVRVSLPPKVPVDSVVEGNIIVDRLKTTVVPLDFVKDGYAVLVVGGERRRVKVGRILENYAEVSGFPAGTPCLAQD